jgi:hypothetical protein
VIAAGCEGNGKQPSTPSSPSAAVSPDQARQIAKDAYIYGFPMVDSYRIEYSYFVNKQGPEYKGEWNQIHSSSAEPFRVSTNLKCAVRRMRLDRRWVHHRGHHGRRQRHLDKTGSRRP